MAREELGEGGWRRGKRKQVEVEEGKGWGSIRVNERWVGRKFDGRAI